LIRKEVFHLTFKIRLTIYHPEFRGPHGFKKSEDQSKFGEHHLKQKILNRCAKKMKVAEITKPWVGYLPLLLGRIAIGADNLCFHRN